MRMYASIITFDPRPHAFSQNLCLGFALEPGSDSRDVCTGPHECTLACHRQIKAHITKVATAFCVRITPVRMIED